VTEPSTFSERLRLFYSRTIVAAGVATGVGVSLLIILLAFGGWPEARYEQIITILGQLALGGGFVMTLVIIFLGLGGPMQRLKATIWKASIETEGDIER